MDEGLSKAVIKVFVELYREGLIYKDKRLVNWDPQAADRDLRPRGRSRSRPRASSGTSSIRSRADEPDRFIVVATTRPETMLGDTGVAVHPDDERYKDLVGKNAILPLVGRQLPIVADDYADPETGTGAVKITPAHDFNDFEVGKRHDLPMINILDAEANVVLDGNADFLAGVPEIATSSRQTIEALERPRPLRGAQAHRRDDGGAGASSRRSRTTSTRCRTATAAACRSSRS